LPKGPEDKDKAKTLKRLRALGGWWYSTPRSRFGASGTPDIIGCFCGRFIGLELKRFDGLGSYGVTKIQMHRLCDINDAGGIGWLINREETLERFIQVLTVVRKAWDTDNPTGRPAQAEEAHVQ